MGFYFIKYFFILMFKYMVEDNEIDAFLWGYCFNEFLDEYWYYLAYILHIKLI